MRGLLSSFEWWLENWQSTEVLWKVNDSRQQRLYVLVGGYWTKFVKYCLCHWEYFLLEANTCEIASIMSRCSQTDMFLSISFMVVSTPFGDEHQCKNIIFSFQKIDISDMPRVSASFTYPHFLHMVLRKETLIIWQAQTNASIIDLSLHLMITEWSLVLNKARYPQFFSCRATYIL